MPGNRQVTAREFFAEALLDVPVEVPAGSFNAEWNKASVRRELNIPESFDGEATQYIKGNGGPSTDRWKVVCEDGDETDEANPSLPHRPVGKKPDSIGHELTDPRVWDVQSPIPLRATRG
ncbi:hypothetical protein CYMTET_12013 [Cymbomonas tetramitiformis]|uniref:Uncharacterized protein n=1 Tax=Cymbomonas tetramitiformis TaxID=36881 RepID=A0AAE0GL85_9CHLO|nr:hypothetical protein CYMTET_12013 [Cymbomonas tetramitiformis]